jgi:D-glycero-D-manno-heptose 1,7-bisphosphate phosphatase
MGNRALILDRDGVINIDHGYVHRPEQCEFVDGIFDLARAFAARGFLIVIATNQAGIGRGLYTEDDFQTFMVWMKDRFREQGVEIAAVYHCPDHPTEGIGAYRRENDWRKPGPGMFLQAAKDLDLDLSQSWCVGDKMSDIQAATAAEVGTRVFYSGEGGEGYKRAGHLIEVVEMLERSDTR